MEKMTKDEYRSFLMDTVRTGKLATVRADGRPHLAPIWFILDGDDLVFTTYHKTVKYQNLQRDPRASLCVDDEAPPFAFVIIEGEATLQALSPEELLPWTTRLARRYMGDDQAESFGQRNAVEGEMLVRVTPTKIIAKKGIAD